MDIRFIVFLSFVLLLAVLTLPGCSTLSADVDKCLTFGGEPNYRQAGSAVVFECRNPRR